MEIARSVVVGLFGGQWLDKRLHSGAGLPWVLLGAFKLVGLLILLALVLKLGLTSVIPLAIGYGALPVGIVFAQLGAARPRAVTSPSIAAGIDTDSGPKGR